SRPPANGKLFGKQRGATMVLRKCPKCKERVNVESVSCPRCGVVFREYRIKRLIFWIAILVIAAWMWHDHRHALRRRVTSSFRSDQPTQSNPDRSHRIQV